MSFLDTSINPDGTAGPAPLSKADWQGAMTSLAAFKPASQAEVAYSTDDLMSGKAAMTTRRVAATEGGKQYLALENYGLAAGYWKPRKDDFIDTAIQTVVKAVVIGGITAGAAGMVGYGPAAASPSSASVDTAAASDAGTLYPPGANPPPVAVPDPTGLGNVLKYVKDAAGYATTAAGLYSTGKGLLGKPAVPSGTQGGTLSPADTGPNYFFGGGSGSGDATSGSGAGSNQTLYLLGGIAVAVLLVLALARS